jgi:uncharacterized protein with GYD domain
MAKYLMLGKYSREAIKGMSAERTQRAVEAISKSNGKIDSMHVLLGGYDLALMVELPGNTEAIKASIALAKLTDIAFTTFPAITVEEFDKITG